MSDFTSPDRTHSVVFRPNGIYYGDVTTVNAVTHRVWVTIPRIVSSGLEFGGENGCEVVSTVLPVVGDRVACVWAENRTERLVVLGTIQSATTIDYQPNVIATSTTRPLGLRSGTFLYETDTKHTYQLDNLSWRGVTFPGDSQAATVYFNTNGLGVGAASSAVPVAVSKPRAYPASVTNASSGMAHFGATTGPNLLLDHNVVQARNNGAATNLQLNPGGGNVTIGTIGGGSTLTVDNLVGALSANLLLSGTVPSGRMVGPYTNITQLGTITPSLTSPAFVASHVSGTTDGGSLTLQKVTGSSGTDMVLENYVGGLRIRSGTTVVFRSNTTGTVVASPATYPVVLRPGSDTTSSRELRITPSGDSNGHYINGRLAFNADGVNSGGFWIKYSSTDLVFFGDRGEDDWLGVNTTGFYSPANNFWPFLINRNGAMRLRAGGNVLATRAQAGLYLELPAMSTTNFVCVNEFGRAVVPVSRREYKNNIEDITNALGTINGLRPRSYTFKGDTMRENPAEQELYDLDQRTGFVVEELLEDAPNLVTYTVKNGDELHPQYYRSDDILALAVAAIKELSEQVEALQSRIDELES